MNEPQIRGTAVSAVFGFIKKHYGEALLRDIVNRLPIEHQRPFQKLVLPISWYPVASYELFLALAHQEISKQTQETQIEFEKRMFLSESKLMQSIYKFVFSLMQPTALLARLPSFLGRLYDQGEVKLIENRAGHCLLRYSGPRSLYAHMRRSCIPGNTHFLEIGGATQLQLQFPVEQVDDQTYLFEMLITYQMP